MTHHTLGYDVGARPLSFSGDRSGQYPSQIQDLRQPGSLLLTWTSRHNHSKSARDLAECGLKTGDECAHVRERGEGQPEVDRIGPTRGEARHPRALYADPDWDVASTRSGWSERGHVRGEVLAVEVYRAVAQQRNENRDRFLEAGVEPLRGNAEDAPGPLVSAAGAGSQTQNQPPRLTSSNALAIRARATGWRTLGTATNGPMATLLVTAASAGSNAQPSQNSVRGPSGRSKPVWSMIL
jgi:hypothetical protein